MQYVFNNEVSPTSVKKCKGDASTFFVYRENYLKSGVLAIIVLVMFICICGAPVFEGKAPMLLLTFLPTFYGLL